MKETKFEACVLDVREIPNFSFHSNNPDYQINTYSIEKEINRIHIIVELYLSKFETKRFRISLSIFDFNVMTLVRGDIIEITFNNPDWLSKVNNVIDSSILEDIKYVY